MFDRGVSDAGLVEAMGGFARAESVAIAGRLAAVGELYARRALEWQGRQLWCSDPFEAVAAEVSAAQNISRGRAGTQIRHARELRERLPQVAAVFGAGEVDYRMVMAIMSRTSNVTEELIATLDAALARVIAQWMKLSGPKLVDRIDSWIARFDPDGVRVRPEVEQSRYVEVGPTVPGMAGIWASIHAADAAAFDQRLDALAATVCKNDPRTMMQRRSDAIGALAAGAQKLLCRCGCPDCPVLGEGGAAPVVIHMLAEQATVEGTANNPGYLPKFGIQPAQSLRAQAATATLTPLTLPGQAQPSYRPSPALSAFIRWRDLTCRWPGCDKPAHNCDIDHTLPYPNGPTSHLNLKPYCRSHHLVKTFYCGPGGWTEQQLPDGTMVYTAPTGHTYTTAPAGAELFPTLSTTAATPPAAKPVTPTDNRPPATNRELAMPTRKRTRDQDRQARITRERRLRAEINTGIARTRAAQHAQNANDPPPF